MDTSKIDDRKELIELLMKYSAMFKKNYTREGLARMCTQELVFWRDYNERKLLRMAERQAKGVHAA